jgi:hypothetical protein
MKRLALLACLLLDAGAAAASAPRSVFVTGTRVRIADVLPGVDAGAAAVDVGPSPSAGGSRVVTRAEIVAALTAKQLASPADVPDAVRVVRKVKHLSPSEMETIVRDALGAGPAWRGVRLGAVKAEHAIDVADGWGRVEIDVPRPPKRPGVFATTAIASFYAPDGDVTARIPVPVELSVSPEGATYDAARGSQVTLVVRRGYVEVRASGVAMSDADIGDPVPVQLRGSLRVVRAKLLSRDEALALEDGQ